MRGSTVRDHGPGVPEGERERIFEPFYRLAGSAESGRGSGLGLALVRQIARHHGGDVRCGAAPGGGSVFEIALPLVEPPAGRPTGCRLRSAKCTYPARPALPYDTPRLCHRAVVKR